MPLFPGAETAAKERAGALIGGLALVGTVAAIAAGVAELNEAFPQHKVLFRVFTTSADNASQLTLLILNVGGGVVLNIGGKDLAGGSELVLHRVSGSHWVNMDSPSELTALMAAQLPQTHPAHPAQ